MHVSGSMIVKGVENCLGSSMATAACFVHTAPCHARRFSVAMVAALDPIKIREISFKSETDYRHLHKGRGFAPVSDLRRNGND
jgi:hypothetical protein